MNLGELVRRHARWTPDKEAVVFGGTRTSYREIDRNSERLIAALLDIGLRKGDCIATLTDNCGSYVEIVAAAAKAGFVIVPVNPRLNSREVAYILKDSGAGILFASDGYAATVDFVCGECPDLRAAYFVDSRAENNYERLLLRNAETADYPRPDLSDLIFISYTSGTTGDPKGAMMSHRNLLANAANVGLFFELNSSSRCLVVLPQSTAGGNHHILVPTLYAGGTFIVHDARKFEAAHFLGSIQAERITNVQLVPTMIYRLLDFLRVRDYDLSSLRTIGYGSAPMSVERLREAIDVFGPVFAQVYGQTECSSLAVFLSKQDHIDALSSGQTEILGSSGRPINSIGLRVVDDQDRDVAGGEVGEVLFQGDTVMSGYLNAPEATRETLKGGWLHTGDLVREDEKGFVYHVDRKKDIIISGGLNISAREIEEVIYRHPKVHECAVIGVPDPQWGESVKAVVSLRGSKDVTAQEIVDLCTKHLAKYKCPKSVDFVDEFVKNSMGKILKRELKKQYWKDSARLVN